MDPRYPVVKGFVSTTSSRTRVRGKRRQRTVCGFGDDTSSLGCMQCDDRLGRADSFSGPAAPRRCGLSGAGAKRKCDVYTLWWAPQIPRRDHGYVIVLPMAETQECEALPDSAVRHASTRAARRARLSVVRSPPRHPARSAKARRPTKPPAHPAQRSPPRRGASSSLSVRDTTALTRRPYTTHAPRRRQ